MLVDIVHLSLGFVLVDVVHLSLGFVLVDIAHLSLGFVMVDIAHLSLGFVLVDIVHLSLGFVLMDIVHLSLGFFVCLFVVGLPQGVQWSALFVLPGSVYLEATHRFCPSCGPFLENLVRPAAPSLKTLSVLRPLP